MSRFLPTVDEGNNRNDLYSRLLKDRIILLTGEVNDDMAEMIVSQLLYLEMENPNEDIKLYINSPGGSISSGMAIFDTMNLIKCDVQTICLGMAASMGSFLLAGGTRGKRYCTPNSEVMIHQPLGGARGQTTDILISAKHIERTRDKMEKYLSEFTGQPIEKLHTDCERDYWLTAQEALEYGLVDEIIENK